MVACYVKNHSNPQFNGMYPRTAYDVDGRPCFRHAERRRFCPGPSHRIHKIGLVPCNLIVRKKELLF